METRLTLDETITFDNEIPLLVCDLRVMLFGILYRLLNYEREWTNKELYHFWQEKLHLPIWSHEQQRYQLLMIDDFKYNNGEYWRHRYLKRNFTQGLKYKGSRNYKARPPLYYQLLEAGREYCKIANIPYFSYKGFEADDFAGAIYNIVKGRSTRPIIFYTVDSDWGQLVSDDDRILFYYCNSRAWKSRFRDEAWMKQWILEKQSIPLQDVKDIVDYKHEHGDKADNLIPGSPKEVIDLINPARSLPKKILQPLEQVIFTEEFNSHPANSLKSSLHIKRLLSETLGENLE